MNNQILSMASMVAVSLYLIGFGIAVLILAIVGLKYVIKAPVALLIMILFSIISLAIGTTSSYPQIDGVLTGFTENFKSNFGPGVLAIFFPADIYYYGIADVIIQYQKLISIELILLFKLFFFCVCV